MSTGAVALSLDAALDGYASQIAHQLGEASALLAAGQFIDGPAGERAMRAGLQSVQQFVGDLQELAGASAPVSCERLEFEPLITRALLRAQTVRGGEAIHVEHDHDLPDLQGDGDAIVRALAQLLRSAAAAASRPVVARIAAFGDGERVRIEISDDGGELTAADAARLFDPFERPRGRGPLVGAGVGMVVARLVVAGHGGSIAAEPVPGGACVTFDLPGAS